jgi:hypothetical protein
VCDLEIISTSQAMKTSLKIKELSGKIKHFKRSLKKIPSTWFLHTMEEFLDWTSINDLNTLYL